MQKTNIVQLRSWIFYLLILFFPTQLARHFWPDFSYLNGLRSDYLSLTFYLTDLFVLGMVLCDISGLFAAKGWVNFLQRVRAIINFKPVAVFVFLLLLLSVSQLFAVSQPLAYLKLLKIFEVGYLAIFIIREMDRSVDRVKIGILLLLGVWYESILAILQVLTQGSLGGPWWFLGERTFNIATPFISQAIINQELILRPYATLPHPNVLGGYLVVVLTVVFLLFQKTISSKNKNARVIKTIFFLTVLPGLLTIGLSLSRTAIVAFFLSSIFLILLSGKKKALVFSLLTATLFLFFIWTSPLGGRFSSLFDTDKKSYLVRERLNSEALKIFTGHPWFGVGLNNFLVVGKLKDISLLSEVRQLQPVHNVFLLIFSETGIVGVSVLVFLGYLLLFRLGTQKTGSGGRLKIILLFQLIFFALFDHYLFTLQQGLLLSALVLGIVCSREK